MALPQCPQKSLTNQLDFLSKKVLPSLMRNSITKAFLKPVDFIAFGLPEYPKIIKCPIDLGTIKDRLLRKFYASSKDCINDLNLMFQNCYLYNGPGDIIVMRGLQLEQDLLLKLKAMPINEIKIVKISKHHGMPLNRKKMKYSDISKLILPEYSESTPKRSIPRKFQKVAIKSEQTKREKSTMLIPDYENCLTLLNELMSSKYKLYNYLFLKPVDVKSLGLSDYYDVVKYPIDLGTIKNNLENDKYKDRESFLNDIYLMINNCLIYNGVNSETGSICKHFQNDFENLFNQIFKEKCLDNAHDDAFYFMMRIMRRHKDIEEMIRCNSEKIANSRQRIDMIVNILEDTNILERKRRKKETSE